MQIRRKPGVSATLPQQQESTRQLKGGRKFSKVLLVDDSRFLADVLTIFFTRDGYSARASYGGEEAIAAVEDEVPDIAFIDLDMPGMSGMDVARHIRASKRARGATLVALSGWEEMELNRDVRDAGFDHFIAKPVDARALRQFMQGLSRGD